MCDIHATQWSWNITLDFLMFLCWSSLFINLWNGRAELGLLSTTGIIFTWIRSLYNFLLLFLQEKKNVSSSHLFSICLHLHFCQGKNAPGVKKINGNQIEQRGNYWLQILKGIKMNIRKKLTYIGWHPILVLILIIDKILINKSYFMLIFAWNSSSFLIIRSTWYLVSWIFGSLDGFNKCDISHFFFKLCSYFH